MDISVVIPVYNEVESLPELYPWIVRVMEEKGFTYEILFIDDGRNDHSWGGITKPASGDQHVKGIRFRRNYGKSAVLHTGFEEAKGEVINEATYPLVRHIL